MRRPGQAAPRLAPALRTLILRLAGENPHWRYRRNLKGLGITVSATSARKVARVSARAGGKRARV